MALQIHNHLSGSKFINMCVANWLLHIFVYAFIPIIVTHINTTYNSDYSVAGWSVLAFSIGMFLPGPFGAHIMERRSRKSIYLRSLLLLGPITCIGYVLSNQSWQFVALQVVQGAAFGLSQTALGTTLVNDILPSKQRNKGDLIYGWAGRLGIPLGFLFGFILLLLVPIKQTYWWVLIPCALSFVLVAQTNVPIKAPVKVPIITLDRFFLPKSLPLSLSMFAAPWVLGFLASSIINIGLYNCFFFACVAIGVLTAFLIQIFMQRRLGQKVIISLCYTLIVIALILRLQENTITACLAYIIVGCGIGGVSSRHLMDWVTKAQHCQRGTAQNTYMLSWRAIFALGFSCSIFTSAIGTTFSIVLCVLSAAIYILWIDRK